MFHAAHLDGRVDSSNKPVGLAVLERELLDNKQAGVAQMRPKHHFITHAAHDILTNGPRKSNN